MSLGSRYFALSSDRAGGLAPQTPQHISRTKMARSLTR